MFKRYLKKLTKENILFFLNEAFISIGKISADNFNSITDISNRYVQPYLRKLLEKTLIHRKVSILLLLIDGVLSYYFFTSLLTGNLELLIFTIMCKLFQFGLLMGYSNYIQDSLLIIEPLLVDSLLNYKTKFARCFQDRSEKHIQEGIRNIIIVERFFHIPLVFILRLTALIIVLSEQNVNMSISLLITYSLLMIVIAYVVGQIMIYFWKKFDKTMNDVRKNDRINKHIINNFNFKYFISSFEPLLKKMMFVKASANIDYLFVSLIFLLSYVLIYKGNNLGMYILITSFVEPIMDWFFNWLRYWPTVYVFKKHTLIPSLNAIKNLVPSPLSQSKEIKIQKYHLSSINVSKLEHYFPDSKIPVLKIPQLSIAVQDGIYTVTGDSGQGKSVFLNILGNEIFPTEGTISIITDNSVINYNDIGYWNLRDTIRYVWVSNVEITGTNAVKLFRTYLDPKHKESYFNKLVSQSDIKGTLNKLLTNEEIIDFVNNPLIEATTSDQILIDKIVKDTLIELLFKSQLFRENESHILDLDISKLSGGQHARLITSFYLVSPLKIVLLDESLERTTKDSSHTLSFRTDSRGIYTRERMIKFIGDISKVNNQTVLLLVQGGKEEIEMIKKASGNCYLGNIVIGNKKASIIN